MWRSDAPTFVHCGGAMADNKEGGTGHPMPPHVRARIERQLNRVGRRLLELEREPVSVPHPPTSGRVNGDPKPGVGDKAAPLR